jgi:hypothetical protein
MPTDKKLSFKDLNLVEGEQFLIQSPSPDWIRRKIFLGDLRDSAVNLISPHSTDLGQQ